MLQKTGPGPKDTSSNPSAPSALTMKKQHMARKAAGAVAEKGASTSVMMKAGTSAAKKATRTAKEISAAQKLAQDLFPEDAQIIGGHAQTTGKKRKASPSMPGTARNKRARTGELPCEDEVNVWLARLRSLTKGKRVLNRAVRLRDARAERGC